jgi:hypothetical protein
MSDVALGAGGAYLGHALSDGDPLMTAAGAAGGVIVSEARHHAAKIRVQKLQGSRHHGTLSCSLSRNTRRVSAVRVRETDDHARRSRRALAMTETELRLMARPQ